MKNIILASFLGISILTSIILLIMKYTGQLDISLFYAISFAFIPNFSAGIANLGIFLFKRFEIFINLIIDILIF